ncbi:M28 family peptidase [candidate division KSB1 bacterium]
MNRRNIIYFIALLFLTPISGWAQLTPDFQWTILPQEQMDEIIGEASGETAFNHIIEMGGYNLDRLTEEYETTFYEAQYVYDMMLQYGLPGARIERYPGGQTWDGIRGELWEVSPVRQKLASYQDLRAMLASGSNNADVTAELVWVGTGTREEIERANVAGKIVVTSGSAGSVHNIACGQMGAEGVVTFNSPRPLVNPLMIPWSGIRGGGQDTKFAFFLPPRDGYQLRDRLLRGETITVHAQVESAMRDIDMQDPVCYIPGTDPDAGETIFCAHLFEGYAKQGANDNKSGSAAILEVARTLQVLIDQGRLPQPKRNIRFLWGPEFSGTGPWVEAHKELMEKTLCNINMDMVGLRLGESGSYFTVLRTTYGNPHYINDVMENYMRYVGETNREYVQNRRIARYTRNIISPSGTDDPMYYYMGVHYGSSDHEVFNDWGVGVPGVIMNTWGDKWYHTSLDRPDNIDPTQLKRVVVVAAAAAYTIASANDDIATQLASEIVSNGSNRIGHQLARGVEELKRSTAETFPGVYKKARGYIESAAINEQATLASVMELATDRREIGDFITIMQSSVTDIAQGNLKTLDAYMEKTAQRLGTRAVTVTLTDLERRAANIIPRSTAKIRENGYRGYQEAINSARGETGGQARGRGLGTASEIQLLVDGKNSALDIKKMVDTQFQQETDLQAILDHLDLLRRAGLIELN